MVYLDTISETDQTVDEAVSFYTMVHEFLLDRDDRVVYDSARHTLVDVKDLATSFINHHAKIKVGIGGEIFSPHPDIVFRTPIYDSLYIVEGFVYYNGAVAIIRGTKEDLPNRYMLSVAKLTTQLFSYPPPS
jgi:hypothetical protein